MGTLLNRRRYMGGGSALPYDTEIEYLQSDGNQWIDTGIYGSNTLKTLLKVQELQTSGGKAIFGMFDNNKSYYLYQSNPSSQWQVGFGSIFTTNSYVDTQVHEFLFDDFKIYKDGVLFYSFSSTTFTTVQPLALFNMRKANGTLYSSVPKRVYQLKMWDNGTLVLDMIPVRKGTTGYMYDRVSGKLFGNVGTGSFTLGQDIVPIEYLESNGTQYVDTRIYINGLTSELRLRYSAYTNAYFACGCRTNFNQKAFVFSNGGSDYKTYNKYFLNYHNSYEFGQTCPNDENIHDLVMTNVVKVDGTAIKTFSSLDFTTEKTLWLFGSNNNDGARYGSMKIYFAQIYDNNILVRDYIPVRAGTTGYLLDKLTHTLYGNSGTGDFILGNDL